jgi:hypothetical protein
MSVSGGGITLLMLIQMLNLLHVNDGVSFNNIYSPTQHYLISCLFIIILDASVAPVIVYLPFLSTSFYF